MTIDIEELKRLAEAAGGDAWTSDAPHEVTLDRFHVWHADGDAVCACYDNIGHMPEPVDQRDVAAFIAAASPQTVLELIATIQRLESAIAKQAKAAISAVAAAKANAGSMLAEAEKARAESSPDVLASERAANTALTEEVERLQAENAKLKSELENEKIESATFRHGHRIASDNCVRLAGELETAKYDAETWKESHSIAKASVERLKREQEESRKERPQTPAEQFAIVMDRSYDGEGLSLAVHDGINFMFSDGDCYDRYGDTLDGYTAEFLTQYQLEQKLGKALKDAERINYLEDQCFPADPGNFYLEERFTGGQTFRGAIDATRQQKG